MRRHLAFLIALAAAGPAFASPADAGWIFRRSRYSHEPVTGTRVNQYAPKQPALARSDPTYLESGYRHSRVTIRGADGSADRLHVVRTWGAGEAIRPYGEWLFPYRAGATPYGPWGSSQGPWTLPFDSWRNPYGLGQLPNPPWAYWPYYSPHVYPPGQTPYLPPGQTPYLPPGQMPHQSPNSPDRPHP